MVTWNRPDEMNICHHGYEVTYSSITGTTTTTAQTENITIADLHICFEFDITIRPITASSDLSYGRATFHDQRELDVQFAPAQNPSQVIVTWTHPNQDWCSLPFMVTYQTPSDNLVVNVTTPEVVFDFVYCVPVSLIIQGINPNDGTLLSPETATVVDATQYPEMIVPVKTINTTSGDNQVEITWNPTEPIGTCNFTYRVVFTTDRGKFTLATKEPNIIFSRDFFCFDVAVVIQAVAGRWVADIGNTTIAYDISPVSDLELNVSHANSTVIVTWSGHPLEDNCGVSYVVAFQRGNRIDMVTRPTPNITFDLFYCVNTTVIVGALHPDGHVSEARNATNSEEYPTSLEPVRNVAIGRVAASVLLSWEISTSVMDCDNLYNVTARNSATFEESTCQGTTGCVISLSDFCPQTDFIIKPASYLDGEEVADTLIC